MRARHLKLNRATLAMAGLLASLASGGASAATCTWNTTNGNWNELAKWLACVAGNGNPVGSPGAVDSATIGATGVVTINTGQSVLNLNNAGRINIDAFGLNLVGGGSTTNTGIINVGGASTANLGVSAGHNINNTGGVINVAAGSVVNQFGSTITGGTINTTGSGALVAFSSSSNFLSNVTLNGTLDMTSIGTSRQRIINGATINGNVNISNGGILSFDSSAGAANQTIGGTATFNLNDAAARITVEGNGITTLGAGVTVRGQGLVGGNAIYAGGNNTLVNNGLISADVAGGTLNLVPPANSGSLVNNNVMRAIGGGTLLLSANVNNSAGQISAGNGSAVVQNGVTISGGTITTSGTGAFQSSSNGGNFLDNVTVNGLLDLTTIGNSRARIINGATINGSVKIANGGILSLDSSQTTGGAQTIGGSGVINLNDAAARLTVEGNGSTTLGAGVTVRGQGLLGGQAIYAGGNNVLTNNGLISADVAGGTLNIVPPANSGSFINNGTLQAVGGGTLLLSTNITANPSGQIVAGAGSSVVQNGVTINGTINASGTGVFTAVSSGGNFLDGVNFNGTLDLASIANARERIINGATLNGVVNISNGGILSLDSSAGAASQALAGTVVINMNDAAARLTVEGNGSTTLGSGVTVRGQGNLGGQAIYAGGNNVLTNNGLISADVAGGTLNIVPPANSGSFINNGTLQAVGGGRLLLSTNITSNPSGQIIAGSGSSVVQNGVTLTGTINSSGSGVFTAVSSGANVLDGVNFNGTLDLASIVNSRERIINGATINGAVNISNGGILSLDSSATPGGAQTILGTGVINMNDAAARLTMEGTGSTTLGAGITVRGQGNVGGQAIYVGGNNTLINNGTLLADVSGGVLTIVAPANGGTLAGTGTLQTSGGAMNLATGAPSTQGRLIMGGAGSTLNLNTQNLTITNDYTNAQSGTGNSFDRRAGVSGTGQIVAGGNAAQAITGAGVTGGNTANATLTLGNVRVGATTFNYQVGNSGSNGPTLRGAIQTNVNGASLNDSRLTGAGVTASNYNAGAPGNNSGNLGVTFTAANAGALSALSGQAINLRSNFENIADQKLNIVMGAGAAAFNAAVGSAGTPVQVANQRVGGSNSAVLVISNTAAAGSFSEDLNASVGSTGGAANGSGSVSGRLAGSSNTGQGAINVGVSTLVAGAQSGTVNLNYQTAGAVGGVSNGLGTASVGTQAVTVNGNVYQAASGALQTAPLNFGTLQVGQTINQSLVVRNMATGAAGFVEDLHASFGASGNSQITGAGSLNGITAGNNSSGANGSMTVSVLGATAGALNSSIAVNYTSAGAVGGVSNGLGTLAAGSQNYGVNGTINAVGNVINQANAQVNNPTINLGAVRVGAAAPSGTVSVTNLASAPPQAALNAAMGSTTGAATASGSFNLLNPGATNNSSLVVGLNTATAGNFTGGNAGTATINFVSDASNVGGCAPNCQMNLAAQVVNVEGKVYTQAVGSASGTSINFGVVRVGDTVSARNITVSNTAASTALNDSLRANASGISGAFSAPASVAGIAAQGSGLLAVALNTATAGIFSQAATLGFSSHNADMADVSAGTNAALSLQAQVNNLANGDFDLLSGTGTLSQTGTSYVLDLGTVILGDTVSSALQLDNEVSGPADLLSGQFDLSGVNDFTLGGWNPLAFLTAGQASGTLSVNWLASGLGLFTDTIVFNGLGTNASDPTGLAQQRQLLIRANVVQRGGGNVPEPGTLGLLLAAAAAATVARRRAVARCA